MSATTALRIRAYEPRDREGVRGLLSRTFGSPGTHDSFEEGNPLGPPLRVVAELDGRIVGFNMWNAWVVHTPEGPVTAYQSGASAVDDVCRGQGVFGKLLAAGEQQGRDAGVEWFVGFPNPASHKSFLRAGWEHVQTLRVRVFTVPALDPRRVAVAPADAAADEPLSPAARFVRWRYERVGALRRAFTARDGTRLTGYFSHARHRPGGLLKLLDIVDGEGRRRFDHAARVVAGLPGPAAVIVRATDHPSLRLPRAVTIRREWDTPLIFKRVAGQDPAIERSLRAAFYCYGDIDAA